MPGLVVFRRRWSVGSDDLVVPGAFLLIIHFICFIVVLVSLVVFHYDTTILSSKLLLYHLIGYSIILFLSICVEIGICYISMRGSILDSDERTTINIWIYLKSLIIFFDITWLVLGSIWLSEFYLESPIEASKKTFITIIITNWALVFITFITIWCTFDSAGRSWVKMKKYQRSMRETESRFNYKRSNSMNRNWRQRKVIRAYQDSWDHRCRLLFCCMGSSERNRNSFTDIARLLSDFFRELDVVPSDVVAGLVLLRKFQKIEREAVVRQRKNGTYEFLSGVPITERTQFLALNDAKNYDFFQTVIHFMYFAQGAYGWPMYFIINRSKLWHLVPELRCFSCCCQYNNDPEVIQDNCCFCNYAALKKTLQVGDIEITYVTYHVDIGETPFFVAIDYTQKKIVISIRGTLSMKDILTDLNAEGEVLPLTPPRDDWLGHKGMTQAAIYIKNKLKEENLIEKALNHNQDRNTHSFDLVLVGHSLGAGTAAILAILLKPEYPTLQCFSYSPPGGLLSMPAVEYSKSFITSVVLGKDVVPRIGLHQMEALRADLINAIQRSVDPKWKTISCSVFCCGCGPEPTSVVEMSGKDTNINQYQEERDTARSTSVHPADSSIALTLHHPLYPPGRIIHIVRHHPKPDEQKYDSGWRNVLKSRDPVYQAIWAENYDFDEVLISPVMFKDHMPDKVLSALKKVVTTSGPRKPQRHISNAFSTTSNENFNDLDHLQYQINHHNSHNNHQIGNFHHSQHHYHHHYPHHYNKHYSNQDLRFSTNYESSNNFSSLNENLHKSSQSNSHSNLSNSVILTPSVQHKVCLETSFTNLQSPLEQLQTNTFYSNSLGGPDSSKTSSIAGSIFGRSQLSSTQYDISSVIDSITTVTRKSPSIITNETTTVIINEHQSNNNNNHHQHHHHHNQHYYSNDYHPTQRLKSVAFDVEQNIYSQMPLKNNYIEQNGSLIALPKKKLSLKGLKCNGDDRSLPNSNGNGNGYGNGEEHLAPLASPETLSEISSISSRTSAPISLANSIERYLHQVGLHNTTNIDEIFESQLHTPKVMRRAPKFTENLSTCAEDKKNIDQYKRMGRVFITFPRIFPEDQTQSLDSSDDSFESAHSLNKKLNTNRNDFSTHSSKSADQLDSEDIISPVTNNPEPNIKKLTFSDSNILDDGCLSSCPNCPCRLASSISNKIECCQRTEHDQCTLMTTSSQQANTGSVDTTYYSANSSLEQFVTPAKINGLSSHHNDSNDQNNKENSTLKPGLLESHFPLLESKEETNKNEEVKREISPLPSQFGQPIVGGRIRKRLSSEEFIFTRTEDLPLLVQLADKSGSTISSPSGRKRKGCIYPTGNSLLLSTNTTATTKYLKDSPNKRTNLTSSNSSESNV